MFFTNFKRIIRTGFVNFWRNSFVTVASILVMTTTLFVLGAFLFLDATLDQTLDNIQDRVDIKVTFRDDVPESTVLEVRDELEALTITDDTGAEVVAIQEVVYASPSEGVIGSYYWQEGSWDSVSTSEVIYDQYFWQILAVDGDNAYVWALPDTATYIPEEPDYMFTINNVTDIVEPIETLLLVAHTSSDSSSVHIDHVYYGLYNFVDDNDEFEYAGSFGESDYYISTNVDTNWYAAEEMSSNAGGHLVSITSEEENDFIHSITEQYGLNEAWIGFTDEATEGDWEWTTGEDVVFTNWAEGEPNNDGNQDCGQMYWNGEWDDIGCDVERPFIMEVDNYIDLEYSNFTIELNGEEGVDDDENGFVEGTLIDEDEDGVWEIFLVDTDENGKADQAYLDNDGDKKPDVLAHDYNEDGEWDKFEELS